MSDAKNTPKQVDLNEVQVTIPPTSCEHCVFAQWDGDTQEGCDFDRLEKFADNGADIIQYITPTNTYFTIHKRFCNAVRNEEWGDQHVGEDWYDVAAKEFAIKATMIIYVDDTHSIVDVERSLQSVKDQTLQPKKVILVLNQPTLSTNSYVNLVQSMKFPFEWEVQETKLDDKEKVQTREKAVDIAARKSFTTFTAFATAGWRFPDDYLGRINNAINGEMRRFVLMKPVDDQRNGLFIQTGLYNTIGGDNIKLAEEKVAEIAGEENTAHMITTWEALPECEG